MSREPGKPRAPVGIGRATGRALLSQRIAASLVLFLPLLALVPCLLSGWPGRPGRLEFWLCVGMYVLSMAGISIGFHRHFAHRAFRTGRITQLLLIILGSMAAQGPLLFWVATHRRHHAYSDEPGDPHSPHVFGDNRLGILRGLLHAHMGWMLSDEVTSIAHYSRDLLKDRLLFRMHLLYPVWLALGLILPAAIGGFLTHSLAGAVSGLLWGGLVRILLVNQASWCVGSVCHLFGGRPFQTGDFSGNVSWVAVLTFGEGLQNNHHAFPSSAAHAMNLWEPDPSFWAIRLLQRAGLFWDVRTPSAAQIEAARRGPVADLESSPGKEA